jgi:hypothetical protein
LTAIWDAFDCAFQRIVHRRQPAPVGSRLINAMYAHLRAACSLGSARGGGPSCECGRCVDTREQWFLAGQRDPTWSLALNREIGQVRVRGPLPRLGGSRVVNSMGATEGVR